MSTARSLAARRHPSRRLVALLALGLVGATALVAAPGLAPTASAAARVTFTNDVGTAFADTTYSTTLTLKGTGFQSVKGGFGGIYVAFGWVDSSWRPSQGGSSGKDYKYVPDSQEKDNAGYQKFVAFPGSDTEYAANGGTIKADGTWSTTMVVPGPVIQVTGLDGSAESIDCRKKTCGIITIGAHGVANAKNETFTKVAFKDVYAGTKPSASATSTASSSPSASTAASTAASDTATGAPTDTSSPAPTDTTTPAPTDTATDGTTTPGTTSTGTAAVDVDRAAAIAGHTLAFTATGFRQGEQVTAVLDDGLAAVGPITVGLDGASAGVLTLPADLTGGTHTLTVRGATSGSVATVSFGARAATPAASAAVVAAPDDVSPWAWTVAGLGAAALLGVIVWRVVGVLRSRRRSTKAA